MKWVGGVGWMGCGWGGVMGVGEPEGRGVRCMYSGQIDIHGVYLLCRFGGGRLAFTRRSRIRVRGHRALRMVGYIHREDGTPSRFTVPDEETHHHEPHTQDPGDGDENHDIYHTDGREGGGRSRVVGVQGDRRELLGHEGGVRCGVRTGVVRGHGYGIRRGVRLGARLSYTLYTYVYTRA